MHCASFARSVRFPSVAFRSQEEFQGYWSANLAHLEAREAYHESFATLERSLVQKGTCAPCLRPANFLSDTDDGVALKDGHRMPDWNRQMRCDCADALTARERALIHFLQAGALAPWTQLLVFGPCSVAQRLTSLVEAVMPVPRLQQSRTPDRDAPTPVLDAPSERFHVVVAQDYLNLVPPLQSALAGIYRVLVAGGRFVFTVPFECTAASSDIMKPAAFSFASQMPAEFRGTEHKFGWDLLPMLRSVGFRQSTAHLYWSEELGYLGSTNFIFNAVK